MNRLLCVCRYCLSKRAAPGSDAVSAWDAPGSDAVSAWDAPAFYNGMGLRLMRYTARFR